MSTEVLELTNIPVSLAIVDKNLAGRLKNKLHAQVESRTNRFE
jgi:hypothetical protein